jgi:hypothetical protein
MTDSQYLTEVKHLPRPSCEQADAFVEYVTSAHSWYKHLPLLPPGERFVFFLNPNAGREWVQTGDGGAFRDRSADAPASERFHYTWQPTADYIQHFGHLDYFADAGTSFLVPMKEGVLDTRAQPRIQVSNGEWLEVPEDIRTAASVILTAVIHTNCQFPQIFLARLGRMQPRFWQADTTLPDRPYDDELLDRIVEVVSPGPVHRARGRRLFARISKSLRPSSPSAAEAQIDLEAWRELENELLPAYAARQKGEMRAAIEMMLELVCEAA